MTQFISVSDFFFFLSFLRNEKVEDILIEVLDTRLSELVKKFQFYEVVQKRERRK